MDPLSGINTNVSLAALADLAAIAPSSALIGAEEDASATALTTLGSTSTMVDFSTMGQMMSSAALFQDQMLSLQPGTATSGGGQNFGTGFASLAAEGQFFVDAFNNLQASIASLNGGLFAGNVPGSAALTLALDSQAQASFANGNSTLTALSQLGITFQPTLQASGGGTLSLDMAKLQVAYNSDAAGAFSLLGKAAAAMAQVSASFVGNGGGAAAFMNLMLQASLASDVFAGSNTALLGGGALAGNAQVLIALNEYRLVADMFS